jgi:hypothetical protein
MNNLIYRIILVGLLFAPLLVRAQENSCRACHAELEGALAAPVKAMEQNDVHASREFFCEACHGGDPSSSDPEIAMSPKKGFIGVPSPRQIPDLCARCHADPAFMRRFNVTLPTDQYEKYGTSRHGLALKTGDIKVAVCNDCHGTHTILPANNPKSSVWPTTVPQTCEHCHADESLMGQYNLPANVYQEYSKGVHGIALLEKKDVGAPACNDCHGNHGAAPPGFETVAQVCRNCHPAQSEMFLASPHKVAFDALGLKECAACHANHLIIPPTDDWLGVEGDHSCSQCHTAGEAGYQTAVTIKASIDSLLVSQAEARHMVQEAEKRGIEVSQAQDILKQARDALLTVRTIIHTVDAAKVATAADSGLSYSRQAAALGRQGVQEFRFRSLGLGVASILITLLIVALWLKLKDIEKRQGKKTL